MMADKKIQFNPRAVFLDSKYTSVKTFLGFELLESNPALEAWIECARNDFNSIYQRVYGACRRSIDTKKLAEMEIRELNKFFECGESLSMAVNIEEHIFRSSEPVFKVELSSKVIFNHYLILLRGNFDTFLTKGYLDILSSGQVNLEPENLDDKQNIKWWATARVQALMWAKDYLEDLIKKGIEGEVFSTGFPVLNPDKIIPALHSKLVNHGLIKDEGLPKFKAAFMDGEGSITWNEGGNSLIYLISKMKDKLIEKNTAFMKITTEVFLGKNGKPFNYHSLNTASSKNQDIPPKPSEVIKLIVSELEALDKPLAKF